MIGLLVYLMYRPKYSSPQKITFRVKNGLKFILFIKDVQQSIALR